MRSTSTLDRDSRNIVKPAERSAISRLLLLLPIAGCLDGNLDVSETRSASTVSGAASGGGCSTAVVLGLSRQIADEIGCEHPNGLVAFQASDSIVLNSSAVLPYLEQDAVDDLNAEAQNHTLSVNSAFRTIAQQYLLYRWWANGSCGISAAAHVGASNHESGRALDLANWSDVISSMSANGWDHDVAGDPVHFDHNASDDIRGQDTMAFQNLWNANNPGDQISVDGAYGPQTEARLKKSPATGFAIGASCVQQQHAELSAVDGPDIAPSSTRVAYTLSLSNLSQTDWPDGVQLAIVGGPSALRDPSWVSDSVIATMAAVPAGDVGTVSFQVTTPSVTGDTPFALQLVVTDGTTTYGTAGFSLTVSANVATGGSPSADGGDTHDSGELSGGCNAGGGASLGIGLALLALVRRRR